MILPDELRIALDIHSTLCVSTWDTSKLNQAARRIIDECNNDRKQLLLAEIDLCKPFDTAASYCIIANAYHFLGAEYRQQTIYYLTKYLANPEWVPCVESDKTRYLAGRWSILGQAYEGEYQLDEALKAYGSELKMSPEYPAAYVHVATVLSKMNRLDEAIAFLKGLKTTDYYCAPAFGSCFNTVIDNYLHKFEDKKARGYVYKPRNRKI